MTTTTAAVIVLAVGDARRFNGASHAPTQGTERADDEGTVLGMTLHNAIASHLPVVVVCSPELAPLAHRQVAARDMVVLPAPRRGGVGDLIAAGVSVRADASGWLVLPADMPGVRSATLQQVARALQTHAVAYAQHRGRRGHPVGFSAELFSELVALTGDEGARRLVSRYPAQGVEVDDPGVLLDADALPEATALRAVKGGTAPPSSVAWPH